jgi:pimeloyl-ACP methyl ester carboxylesterase
MAHTGLYNPKMSGNAALTHPGAAAAGSQPHLNHTSAQEELLMPAVHHRYATIDGHRLFFREAGDPDGPALVLLHGFPTSSYMFRHVLPALADRYHVIAPDHLGFGLSDAPGVVDFDYTFDALTGLTAGLLRTLGIDRYAMYVQDYGAPIGWRLALRDPAAITAIISQNGNGYGAGFVESFWKTVWDYQTEQTVDTEAAVRQFLTLDATRWQYVTGVPDETLVDPESWYHDYALISRPGNDEVQLKLLLDYASNALLYPRLHEYFRTTGVPLLAVWGRGDKIFSPAGAQAFADDLSDAEIHLLDGGHFLLESALDEVAGLIRVFLAKHHPAA